MHLLNVFVSNANRTITIRLEMVRFAMLRTSVANLPGNTHHFQYNPEESHAAYSQPGSCTTLENTSNWNWQELIKNTMRSDLSHSLNSCKVIWNAIFLHEFCGNRQYAKITEAKRIGRRHESIGHVRFGNRPLQE